jgi:hypothetical protein
LSDTQATEATGSTRRVEKLDSKIGKADQCSPKARVEGEVSLQSGHGHKGVCWVKTYVM